MKTLQLDLGIIMPLQADAPALSAGWYWDTNRGIAVYYDPLSQSFYTLQGGVLVPLFTWNAAPKQVTIAPGDKLKLTMGFNYSGPAVTGVTALFSIGVKGMFGYTGQLEITQSKSIEANLIGTPQARSFEYTFTIPANVGSDWDDIRVALSGGTPDIGSFDIGRYENALVIIGTQPSITDFAIKDFDKV